MSELIDSLIEEGWLKSPEIIEAFEKIKRKDFMPPEMKEMAEINEALPIGQGQTISQPLVVAFMIEKLKPAKGHNILDIGSGSGWTTGLLSYIAGKEGRVTALELLPELKEFGESNLKKYSFIKKGIASFVCRDGSRGFEEKAPFDRILVSASVQGEIPNSWKNQLKKGGRIVAPVGSSIMVLEKENNNSFKKEEYPGFAFVPLVSKNE